MKVLRNNLEIEIDDEDWEKIRFCSIWIEKLRDSYIVRIDPKNGSEKRPTLGRYLLNEYESYLGYKDGNPLNLTRENLLIKDISYRSSKRKQYYKDNKEKIKEINGRWFKNNRVKAQKARKDYRKTPQAKFLSKIRRTQPKYRYSNLKKQARVRKLELTINYSEYEKILENSCYYCNKSISNECGSGLDRVDNTHGYILGNVLSCCGDCNKTRSNRYTVEEFKVMIDALLDYKKN